MNNHEGCYRSLGRMHASYPVLQRVIPFERRGRRARRGCWRPRWPPVGRARALVGSQQFTRVQPRDGREPHETAVNPRISEATGLYVSACYGWVHTLRHTHPRTTDRDLTRFGRVPRGGLLTSDAHATNGLHGRFRVEPSGVRPRPCTPQLAGRTAALTVGVA